MSEATTIAASTTTGRLARDLAPIAGQDARLRRMTLRQRLRVVAEHQGGRATLAVLCLILLLAVALRVEAAANPTRAPLPDSIAYERLASDLYERDSFGDPGMRDANDYSPGTPLMFAGVYYLTGGVHPLIGRLLVAVLSAFTVLLIFLLARRLLPGAEPWVALFAAFLVAIYPVFRSFAGMVMSEPLAAFALTAAVLAALRADQRRTARAWALPGVLLGITTLIRPDYLPLGAGLALLAWLRLARTEGRAAGATAAALAAVAFAAPILPWTARNIATHHRLVPISTGGGKALFIGTYVPAYDGELDASSLNERIRGRLLESHPGLRREFRRTYPTLPLRGATGEVLDTLARRLHPGTPADQALTRMGLRNLGHYTSSEPLHVASVAARKVWASWSHGDYTFYHPTMKRSGWIAFHRAIVALGLLGLALLALRRRWEAVVLGALIVWVALLTMLLIPSPRRLLILIPVLAALSSVGVAWLAELGSSRAARLVASR
jgi:4-amino-4-deoxy-L-arabinose transferase-like glycosyltransferase